MIKINSFLKYLLIVIGILGCGIYFIVPTLVLLLGDFISFLTVVIPKKEKHENHDHKEKKHKLFKKNKKINTKENTIEAKLDYLEHPQEQPSEQLIKTKNEIALHLLEKNSDLNFISDITGFSIDYIKKIKEEAIFDHNKNSTI